jgi:hypothetical protein
LDVVISFALWLDMIGHGWTIGVLFCGFKVVQVVGFSSTFWVPPGNTVGIHHVTAMAMATNWG